MEYLSWWSWKLPSPSLVFGWFLRILTPSEQSTQAILIETFLHWETFLFSILIFWIFEMRKTFNKWAAFPLYLFFFFLKIPLRLLHWVVWCAVIYSVFFCWIDLSDPAWIRLTWICEWKETLFHKMKPSWVVNFSSVEALGK